MNKVNQKMGDKCSTGGKIHYSDQVHPLVREVCLAPSKTVPARILIRSIAIFKHTLH